jgi:fermentation-respiration switch protein FrsA (DUF1100 family)
MTRSDSIMKRGLRYTLAGVAGAVILAYSGAVGFLAFRETSLVFASAGDSPSPRWFPAVDGDMWWDSVRIRADDGAPVFLIQSRIDSAPRRPWAIYLHGNAGLLGSRGNIARYRLLRDAGFNVLAVEYRGYGASVAAGRPSEAGVYADARAAWTHLTESLHVAPARVAVYGWSLGSGPATYLAVEKRPGALITEGTFTSLPDVGAMRYPWVPVRLVMRNRFDNLARAGALSMPWLLFHGTTDADVPFAHSQRLAAAAHGARLIPLAAGHNDGVTAERAKTLAALRDVAQRLASNRDR